MKLRLLLDGELPAVVALFSASVHELTHPHYDERQRHAWAPANQDLSAWQIRLNRLTTMVAEDEGELAGFIAYASNGHIDLLYVSPAFARRGVASCLLAFAESDLVQKGVGVLNTEASLVAHPFFEKQGFETIEHQLVERNGVAFRRFAMRKHCMFDLSMQMRFIQ